MKQSDDDKLIPMTSFASGTGQEVASDIYYYTNQIVNVIFYGEKDAKNWLLIDAGMPKRGKEIIRVAEERFGTAPPAAILLTHGHFDHVGGIVELLEKWKCPVYAHPREFPFLTGGQAYLEPDPGVEGGLLAKISSYYPNEPINISEALRELPADRTVPQMPGWQWIHTPGHCPGHVSFFRQKDRVLIAGDAFVTVRTDSFYKVLTAKAEVNGPPRYFTTDWEAARRSVEKLAALRPETAITGHGPFMNGDELQKGLDNLVNHFDDLAVPEYGRYVRKTK